MTRGEIELVISEAMNLLEHDFGVEELENFGAPTVEDIARRIIEENPGLVSDDSLE